MAGAGTGAHEALLCVGGWVSVCTSLRAACECVCVRVCEGVRVIICCRKLGATLRDYLKAAVVSGCCIHYLRLLTAVAALTRVACIGASFSDRCRLHSNDLYQLQLTIPGSVRFVCIGASFSQRC